MRRGNVLMATHFCDGSVGGYVGGKTHSTGQGELAAGFETRSVTVSEAGDALLWDAVQKQCPHMPCLPTYLCTHAPLGGGMLQDKVHGRGAVPPVGLVSCEEGIAGNIPMVPRNSTLLPTPLLRPAPGGL